MQKVECYTEALLDGDPTFEKVRIVYQLREGKTGDKFLDYARVMDRLKADFQLGAEQSGEVANASTI